MNFVQCVLSIFITLQFALLKVFNMFVVYVVSVCIKHSFSSWYIFHKDIKCKNTCIWKEFHIISKIS